MWCSNKQLTINIIIWIFILNIAFKWNECVAAYIRPAAVQLIKLLVFQGIVFSLGNSFPETRSGFD